MLRKIVTVDDIEKVWRPLTIEERNKAEATIEMALDFLTQVAVNNRVDLCEKLDDCDTGEIFEKSVRMVVISAVKRAMVAPQDMPELTQWSQSASPYSESMTFVNPNNDLYFKKNELALLGLGKISGKSSIGILRRDNG